MTQPPHPGMQWYRAYRVLVLVAAIFASLWGAGAFAVWQLAGRSWPDGEGEIAAMFFSNFSRLWAAVIVLYGVCAILFFLTYAALRCNHRCCLYLVYAQTAVLPLSALAIMPLFISVFRVHLALMNAAAGEGGLDPVFNRVFEQMISVAIPASFITGAGIALVLLIQNSRYFHKRRHLLGTGQRL